MRTRSSSVYRAVLALVLLALLPLAPLSARAALAAESLPALTPTTSARFKYLSTIQRDDATWTAYGEGTHIAPDRVSVWSGATSRSTLATFTRIGPSLHRNDGAGWRQVSEQPLGPTYVATLGAQLDTLQADADTVERIGDATVDGVATTHYQLWLRPGRAAAFVGDTTQLRSGEREQLDRASYKIDLWIGEADQRLYQQLVTLSIPTEPTTTVSTLLTFSGFDDPAIAIDAPPTTVPRYEPVPCRTALPEGVQAECGDLVVLADRNQPDGPTLRLAVIRLPATGPNPSPTPLVYLAGGPGQAGNVALASFTTAESPASQLRENHTLLLLDQRGTGVSQPSLTCPEMDAVESAPDDGTPSVEETNQRTLAAVRDCYNRLLAEGENLAAYTSAANAADINDLRLALGVAQLDLIGGSYGTRLALTVMRDFPQAVRGAVLSSVLPLQVDLLSGQSLAFNNALETVFATCANDAACNSAFPSLRESFSVAVAQLDAEPVTVRVRSLTGDQIYPLRVDGQVFARAIYFMLLVPPFVPFTPALIDNAAKGDYAAITIPYANFFGTSEGISQGMSNSVNCSDEFAFVSEQDFQAVQGQILPELRAATQGAFDFAKAQCAIWNVPQSPAIENQPVVSDVPTLILSGQFDPVTPVSYGAEAARTLGRSTAVELLGTSHDPTLASPCGIAIVQSFLQNPAATLDASCADDAPIVFAAEIPAALIAATNADVPTP
jgi:pimeloyl-ACP methyl ester carboxylesterase